MFSCDLSFPSSRHLHSDKFSGIIKFAAVRNNQFAKSEALMAKNQIYFAEASHTWPRRQKFAVEWNTINFIYICAGFLVVEVICRMAG